MKEKQATTEQDGERADSPKISHEPLFGGLLFGFMVFLACVALGIMGWGVYRGWRSSQERAVLPSIVALPEEDRTKMDSAMENPVPVAPEVATETEMAATILKKAQDTEIKVLNGGAVKGSASVVTDVLKKSGYTKAVAGNTIGDYMGAIVYFAPDFEKEADIVKESLMKSYPKAETKPAIKENKETNQAPLTIILGK